VNADGHCNSVIAIRKGDECSMGGFAQQILAGHEEFGRREVLALPGEVCTYGRLMSGARRMLGSLQKAVAPGATVALWTNSARHCYQGLWACVLGGYDVALVPRRPDMNPPRFMFATVGADVVVADGIAAAGGEETGLAGFPLLDPERLEEAGDEATDPTPREGRGVTVYLFTSGTTGRPKAVVFDEARIAVGMTDLAAALDWTKDTRVLSLAPVASAMSMLANQAVLLIGGLAALPQTMRPNLIINTIAQRRTDTLSVAPFLLELLTRYVEQAPAEAEKLASVQRITYSASPMPAGLVTRARRAFRAGLVGLYAATEMMVVCVMDDETHERLFDPASPGVCLGRTLEGVEIRVVDEAGAPVPDGTPGNILARAPWVAARYLGSDFDSFRDDGFYDTRDVGVHRDGLFYLVGRSDEMIKITGEKVYPVEIDLCLRTHPAVADAASFPIEDEVRGSRLGALIVPSGPVRAGDLRQLCRKYLPPAKTPADFWFGPSLPVHGPGKVNRKALQEMCLAESD